MGRLGHVGFSYVGLLYLVMLFVPNLFWTRCKPAGYTPGGEKRLLVWCERVGQVAVTGTALLFTDFNLRPFTWWSLWLAASFLLMLLYEVWWVRYFRSGRTLQDFYSSFCGVPVAGATLPVLAFGLLAVYGRVVWLLLSTIVLGIGHIGIHWQHKRRIADAAGDVETAYD